MSKELILLPKSKYEELLKAQETTTRSENVTDKNQEEDGMSTSSPIDSPNQEDKSELKPKPITDANVKFHKRRKMVGGGRVKKAYVRMRPQTFFKNVNPVKQKWLSFSL